jgi:hypothetical protein
VLATPKASSLTYSKPQNPLILCVINGDEKIFMKDLVIQGQAGGKAAAQHLTKAIAEYLSKEELHIFGRLSFWTTIYVNKSELFTKLLGHDFCTAEQLNNFFSVSEVYTSLSLWDTINIFLTQGFQLGLTSVPCHRYWIWE